uniref:Tetraspanin n=1 Tax=Phlebotomus papatasi TaxID=29031 RepID=A0A1B0D6J3_PHLPP
MTANSNNLNVGMRCIKYMLFVINFMFVLTSVLLITVGLTIKTIFSEFDTFVDDHFMSAPTLLVAIGFILLAVALFGCVGAAKESTAMINIYGVLLAIIFVLEVAAAISAFVLQGQVEDMLVRTMFKSLDKYNDNPYIRDAVDFMQSALECCGVHGREDWEGILATANPVNTTEMSKEIVLPESCCEMHYQGEHESECVWFTDGCFNQMNFVISQSAMLIATGATTVAFVQILGVICAFMLAKTIRRTKTQRALRQWQLQQSLGIYNKPINHYNPPYVQLNNSEKPKKDPDAQDFIYQPNSPSVN